MLHVAIGRFIQIVSPGKIFAGIDATGFENKHATPYYSYKCNLRHAFTKMSAGSDMKSQLICTVVIQHHPVSHDVKHFPKLFSQMLDVVAMQIMVLDKGYDSEPIHKMIRDENIISVIPVRGDNLISDTHGKYRKLMRREFDESLYHERNKTETIFSVVKRRFDSEIKSYDDTMKTKELLYRVLAYNCHRMCLISALVLWMISRKPPEAKILISLRNPIERAYSAYLMHWSNGTMKKTFSDQISYELTHTIDLSKPNIRLHRGLYYEDVKRYLEIFGQDNVKIIFFEEWIKDPKKTIENILKFINVNCDLENFHDETYNQFSTPKGKFSQSLLKNQQVVNFSRIIPFPAKRFFKNKIIMTHLKPSMGNKPRKILFFYYQENVEKLQSLLDKKIPWPDFV